MGQLLHRELESLARPEDPAAHPSSPRRARLTLRRAAGLALAALIIAPAGASARPPKVDPAEAVALGYEHALAHARQSVRLRHEHARWRRLSPTQRKARLARFRHRTSALNARLEQRGRDEVGYWQPSLIALPEYAIHASVLPTGKILFFGREPLVGDTRSNKGSARLYDPRTGAITHVPPPPVPENPGPDGPMPAPLFCAGSALLSDGTVLVAGGNLESPDTGSGKPAQSGLADTFIFNPWTETWTQGPSMQHGRWYPTLNKLPSGDVMILSGYDENGQGKNNPQLDVYRPGVDQPGTTLTPYPGGARGKDTGIAGLAPDAGYPLGLYPGLFTLPDGNVALAGPAQSDSAILDTARALDRSTPPGAAWTQILGTKPSQQHYAGSILQDPDTGAFGGSWRVLVIGGADGAGSGYYQGRVTVDTLTAGPTAPSWSHDAAGDLSVARFYPNTVTLPDGSLVTIGGGAGADYRTLTSPQNYGTDGGDPKYLQVELRKPGSTDWTLGAAQQEFRTYHSVAALLPDGRVWSAGDDGNEGPPSDPVGPNGRRDSAEVFWPPYLFDGDQCALRPVIRGIGAPGFPADPSAPAATLTYGETFGVFSEHARPGTRAMLVAPAAVTHSLDMNQRLVPLRGEVVDGGGVNAVAPENAAIAPPGWYMLFLVDAAGTPSESRWVRVLDPVAAAAARTAGPETVTGPRPAPQGRRCVDPDGTERSEPDPPVPTPEPSPSVTTTPSATPTSTPAARRPALLGLSGVRLTRTRLDLAATLTPGASGTVRTQLRTADGRVTATRRLKSAGRGLRIRVPLPRTIRGARRGTVTVSYGGDARVLPQSVAVGAAGKATTIQPSATRVTAGGAVRLAGTVGPRGRGKIEMTLRFDSGGRRRAIRRLAAIKGGRYGLRTTLTKTQRGQLADRTTAVMAVVRYAGSRTRSGTVTSVRVLAAP